MYNKVRIAIDHENNAEAFWGALTEYDAILVAPIGEEAREAAWWLAESAPGHDEVIVSAYAAERLLAWFSTLPEWNDGPEYAPHPIIAHEEHEEME